MYNKNTKSLAEKIDKNSFGEIYASTKVFYYYSKEYIEKFTKAGQFAIKHFETLYTMTQEEKQLLIKDLCARLSYGVKGLHRGQVHKLFTIDGREENNACIQVDGYDAWFSVDTFKPYLRPMSSMTQEEIDEYDAELDKDLDIVINGSLDKDRHTTSDGKHNFSKNFVAHFGNDWLNAHHFDYRGLIEKGLALKAPEEMYKEK